jgi:hypothetical protein
MATQENVGQGRNKMTKSTRTNELMKGEDSFFFFIDF